MVSQSPFYRYVEDVLSGKEVVGKYIRLAVERFIRDCDKKDYVFDYDRGYDIVKFAAMCYHWKGPKAGTPLILDPHQHFYLIQKYGWVDPNTNLPRFSRAYKQIARKTGKTTEGAVEALFHMSKGIEDAAQVWTCATKEDDAIIIVNDAGRIVQASPLLKNRFRVQIREPYVRRVMYPARQAFMAYMTAGQDAVDTSMGIGDECHDWPDASVKYRIESSMGNRQAPSFTNMTTAGFNRDSYCYTKLRQTSVGILEGTVIDENQLVIIYELDEGDEWQNEEVWVKANPDIPFSSTKLPNLKRSLITAINEGGSTEVNFKTKNLNMWVDAPATFIPSEVWDKNTHGLTVENGESCYAGLQVGPSGDISALALLFPGEVTRIKMLWMIAEEDLKTNDFYRENRQLIKVDPGNVLDNDVAIGWITEEFQKYNLHSFCFPKPHEKNSIVQGLIKQGYEGNPISEGLSSISTPTDAWEKMLRSAQIEHFNDPILKWHNSNCLAVRKEAGIRLEKNGKVLGIWACIMAVAQWQTVDANGSGELGIVFL